MKANYSTIAKTFDKARYLSEKNIEIWLDPISHICCKEDKIADLGCGTGRFAIPLAYKYNFSVTGIDSSIEMIAKAKAKDHLHKIQWIIQDLENFNTDKYVYDGLFMSHLLHHISQKKIFLHNCYNVLKETGKIFIRHGAIEQIQSDVEHTFFPSTIRIDRKRTLGISELEKILDKIGFKKIRTIKKRQNTHRNAEDHYNRIKLKCSSVLTLISEKEFTKGLKKLREYINNNPEDQWLLYDEMSLTIGYK